MKNRYKGKSLDKLKGVSPMDCNSTEIDYILKRFEDHASSLLAGKRYYEQKIKESELIAKAKDEVHEYYKPIIKKLINRGERLCELVDEAVEIGMNEGKQAVQSYIKLKREKDKLNFRSNELNKNPVANIKSQQHFKPKTNKDPFKLQFEFLRSAKIPPDTLTNKQTRYWNSFLINRLNFKEVANDMGVKEAQVKTMYDLIIPKIKKHIKNK
tara:strand:+ start:92 stop:727 length:636 start_codon:yes stop_codon:yes gene_type:complete